MTFDGIITRCVVNELNKLLLNGRIEKITQPEKLELNIHLYNKEKFTLSINLNASNTRINLTNVSKQLPLKAPNFCMCLRKHIQGYKVIDISQYMMDRIIKIELEGFNELNDKESKYLIIELMGKHSNCILVNNKYNIIDSIKHVDNTISSVRQILPHYKYEYPKTKLDFSSVTLQEFSNMFKEYLSNNEKNTIESFLLNNFNGFSKTFINMILNNVNITPTLNTVDDNIINKIYNEINLCLNNIDNFNYSIINENTNKIYIDYLNTQNNISINTYLNDFFKLSEAGNDLKQAKNDILKSINSHISKLNNNLKILNNNIKECEDSEKYRIYGELITNNLYKNISNSSFIEVENYYDNNNIISIPLDKTLSLSKNAQKYFKKYAKLKNSYAFSIEKKVIIENEITYLESIIYEIENTENLEDINSIRFELIEQKYLKNIKNDKKKKDNISLPIEYEYNGYNIFVGKNNMQNEYITHKIAKPNDIWLHAQKIHGSHVIIKKINDAEIPNNIIEFASNLAAFYSKGKDDSKITIDYCIKKYVKKHPSSKPGMVTYTNFNSIYTQPIKHEEYIKKH